MVVDNNHLGNNVLVGENVEIGVGNVIGHNCIIGDGVRLGDHNFIGAGSILGGTSNHVRSRGIDTQYDARHDIVLDLGNSCVLGEFVTVHLPVARRTTIGSRVAIGSHTHVAHDCVVDDDAIISVNCSLGGYVHLHEGANMGMGAQIHPRLGVGRRSMIGMGAVVLKHVPPFSTVAGNPARVVGINAVGMRRGGYSGQEIAAVEMKGVSDVKDSDISTRVMTGFDEFAEYLTGSFVRPVEVLTLVHH